MAETKIDSNGVTFPDATVQATAAINATKQIFAPVHYATDMDVTGGIVDGGADLAYMKLQFPNDFTSIDELDVVIAPRETAASMHFSFQTYWGNEGEGWNLHQETANHRDIGAVSNSWYIWHDISDLVDVAAPAAGDVLLVRVNYSATAVDSNAHIVGLRLRYS